MTFVIFRSLLTANNARASTLCKHKAYILEYVPCSLVVDTKIMRGFTSRRSNHSACNVGRLSRILGDMNSKRGRFIDGSRLASTFVVEDPGKLSRVVGESQNIPNSSDAPISTGSVTDPIPEPPPVPVDEIFLQVASTPTEPTFASLGLGGWSPVGMIENCMEYLHVGCGIPWWGSILIGTAVVRILMFPLVVVAQRNSAKMNNNLPQLQVLQLRMTEARQCGNHLEAARYAQEMMMFMKEKELSPLKNMIVPLAQAPVFISFFMALRSMSNLPVPDMVTGGLWWFTDLTMPDQYFLLPLLTSATLFLTIEIGTDSGRLNTQNSHVLKYILRALPICIFPFTVNFPGAVLCYWLSSNVISLIQVSILKIPRVREFCKIDKLVHIDPESLPNKPKGFVEGFRESMNNMKITREMEERERFDEFQFKRAGTAPIQKTFKYDPTRSRDAISAKKHS